MTARTLSAALAAITERLEAEEASYVTLERIAELAADAGVRAAPSDLAWRLRKAGWLIATPERGLWEFAPAAHAGPYGRGDTWALLKGASERRDALRVHACMVSALWLRGLSERPPTVHEISGARAKETLPKSLRTAYRYLRFDARLPSVLVTGVATEAAATTLVHAAARPAHVSSWEAFEHALPVLAREAIEDDLVAEMAGRPSSVGARLGYLLSGVAPGLAESAGASRAATVVRLGGHRAGLESRFNSDWNVADSLLPFDPSGLSPAPVATKSAADLIRARRKKKEGAS